MKHFTYDGPRTCKGGTPSNARFTAWAEYADGSRATFKGTGPECNRWMNAQRRAGATRHGMS